MAQEVGDVLYTNSTLALDADTGEIDWYFQHIPGGNWDQDHPFERLIVETEVTPDADAVSWMNPNIASSERRKVITGIPGKPGIVWTLDAATGEFLWATETNFQNVIVGVDVEGRKGITNPEINITEIGQQKLVCPTTQGGINWNSVGYSPQTNSLYTPTNNTCMNFALRPVDPTVGLHHASAQEQHRNRARRHRSGRAVHLDRRSNRRDTVDLQAARGHRRLGTYYRRWVGLCLGRRQALPRLRCRERRHPLGTDSERKPPAVSRLAIASMACSTSR